MPRGKHSFHFHTIQSGAGHLASGNPGRFLLPLGAWAHLCTALRLSPREMQIVQGVFEDQKEESIAYELGISPHTVNTYFQRLYTKLHVSSRPQLIVRVMAEYLTLAPRSFNGSFVDVVPGMSGARATDEDLTWRKPASVCIVDLEDEKKVCRYSQQQHNEPAVASSGR